MAPLMEAENVTEKELRKRGTCTALPGRSSKSMRCKNSRCPQLRSEKWATRRVEAIGPDGSEWGSRVRKQKGVTRAVNAMSKTNRTEATTAEGVRAWHLPRRGSLRLRCWRRRCVDLHSVIWILQKTAGPQVGSAR